MPRRPHPLRALLFGEALIDEFPDHRAVAGAPLHLAVHLAAWGWRAQLLTRLGADGDALLIRRTLHARGLDTTLIEQDPALPTGRVSIHLTAHGHTFTIHGPAAWDAIAGPVRLPPHDLLYFGTLAGRSAVSRATLRRLLAASAAPFRVLDVNLRPPDIPVDVLGDGLTRATLLKANAEEFQESARLLGIAPEPAAYFGLAPALRWLCLTRGPDGAELHDRAGRCWRVAADAVAVVDSVGAGDAFTAGLVDALARGQPEPEALARARAAATAGLLHRGGLPPRGSDLA